MLVYLYTGKLTCTCTHVYCLMVFLTLQNRTLSEESKSMRVYRDELEVLQLKVRKGGREREREREQISSFLHLLECQG